jgi:hypothetical protein
VNEFPNTSGGKSGGDPVLWLFLALTPSVAGIICLKTGLFPASVLPALVVLDVACCAFAAAALTNGIKDDGVRIVLAVLTFGFFFLFNIFIALYVGCTPMHL